MLGMENKISFSKQNHFLLYNKREDERERMKTLITRIEDHYVDFAPQLQDKLNETLGAFLKGCDAFFEENQHASKNFATYIRGTDPLHPSKNEYYFIIELDNYTLLDVYGTYDPKSNELSKVHFRATLPYHVTWNSDHFSEVSFSEEERVILLKKQETFAQSLKQLGVLIVFDLLEFNPERDILPEALVEFRPTHLFENFTDSEEIFSFMKLYYDYCFDMNNVFEEKINQIKKG